MSIEVVIIVVALVLVTAVLVAARTLAKALGGGENAILSGLTYYAAIAVRAAQNITGSTTDAALAEKAAEYLKNRFPTLPAVQVEALIHDALHALKNEALVDYGDPAEALVGTD